MLFCFVALFIFASKASNIQQLLQSSETYDIKKQWTSAEHDSQQRLYSIQLCREDWL